jgi:hypothetical protein
MSKIRKSAEADTKQPKVKYQLQNWSEYNKALVKRGNITLYFDEQVLKQWYSDEPAQRGAQEVYSDRCIEAILMLKVVFKLAYRQVQGFAQSLLQLLGLDLQVPSYSQINRRGRLLMVEPFGVPPSGPIVLVVDSTGIKVYGEGEWKVRKHGWSKRRTWRKLHLGVDPKTGFIHCHTLTTNQVSDAAQLPQLLEQVSVEVDEFCGDGAYDQMDCWDELTERGIRPIIPPRENAVYWYERELGDLPDYPRNWIIDQIEQLGRKKWKEQSGYHRRSLAETAMFRYKTIHGNKFYSRLDRQQQTEVDLKIKTLNIMTAQGRPVSKPRKTA